MFRGWLCRLCFRLTLRNRQPSAISVSPTRLSVSLCLFACVGLTALNVMSSHFTSFTSPKQRHHHTDTHWLGVRTEKVWMLLKGQIIRYVCVEHKKKGRHAFQGLWFIHDLKHFKMPFSKDRVSKLVFPWTKRKEGTFIFLIESMVEFYCGWHLWNEWSHLTTKLPLSERALRIVLCCWLAQKRASPRGNANLYAFYGISF